MLPTDRGTSAPNLGVGIDTIAVQGPTTPDLLCALREQRIDRDFDWTTGEIIDSPKFSSMDVQVGAAWGRLFGFRHDGQAWLRAEVSLPTMLNGHNRDALGLYVLVDAVEAALILLSEQLPDIPELEQVVVQRLDLPRDFRNVESIHAVLAAMHMRHVPHAKLNEPHYTMDGTIQSLRRGTRGRYVVSGYDKAHELGERAAGNRRRRNLLEACATTSSGLLRVEQQLRAPVLREKGLISVTDVANADLRELSEEYFVRTRWAQPYGGRGRVQQTLEELRPTLSAADYRNLCCYVFCAGQRMDVPLTRHTIDRVRPLARRHNLLDPEDDHHRRRLDFETGTEVEA